MNIALTISQSNRAMLVYDRPFGFIPAWIESAPDGRGVRIISEDGQEFMAGVPAKAVLARLPDLHDVLLVRMENRQPVESFSIPFIRQNYEGSAE